MDLYRTYNKDPRVNFVVVEENKSDSEAFYISAFDPKTKQYKMVNLKTGLRKVIYFDKKFLESSCFTWQIQ